MDLFEPDYLAAWARAFVLTQAVEAPIYRRYVPTRLWVGLVPSAITHPFVWFLFPRMQEHGATYLQMALAAELFAWLAEALLLWRALRTSWRRALLVSLLANSSSVAVGLFLRQFGLV